MSETGVLLKYPDVAKRLGVSVRQVKRLRAKNAIQAVVLGKRTIRFRAADVERTISKKAGDRGDNL